jgi:hypothetical protein
MLRKFYALTVHSFLARGTAWVVPEINGGEGEGTGQTQQVAWVNITGCDFGSSCVILSMFLTCLLAVYIC